MTSIPEFKKIIKGSYGIAKELSHIIDSLGVTVYIGNQFTTYFFDLKRNEPVLILKQFFNPNTNDWDIETLNKFIPDPIEYFENELIPPGYQVRKIFYKYKMLNPFDESDVYYWIYNNQQLFYGCDKELIKKKNNICL